MRWPSDHEGGDGVVLLDPREGWTEDDWDPLAEEDVQLSFKPDRSPTGLRLRDSGGGSLHLATDDELVLFAAEAEEVINGFAERFAGDADTMTQAVTSTSQYRPR